MDKNLACISQHLRTQILNSLCGNPAPNVQGTSRSCLDNPRFAKTHENSHETQCSTTYPNASWCSDSRRNRNVKAKNILLKLCSSVIWNMCFGRKTVQKVHGELTKNNSKTGKFGNISPVSHKSKVKYLNGPSNYTRELAFQSWLIKHVLLEHFTSFVTSAAEQYSMLVGSQLGVEFIKPFPRVCSMLF